jgi:hypothetical protein
MKILTAIFITVMCFYGAAAPGDWLNPKWVPLCIAGGLMFSWPIFSKNRPLGLAVAYSLILSSFHAMSNSSYFNQFGVIDNIVLRLECAKALVFIICLCSLLKNFEHWEWLLDWLWIPCIVTSVWAAVAYFCDSDLVGMSFNKSLSATLGAMLLPFVLKEFPRPHWTWIVTIGSIIIVKSSISFFACAGVLMTYYVLLECAKRPKYKRAIVIASITGGLVLISLVSIYFGEKLFNTSRRLDMWQWTIQFMRENEDMMDPFPWIFGFGPGTFTGFGSVISDQHYFFLDHGNHIFVTLHNDILQCLFEMGGVGLALWSWAFGWSAWRVRSKPWAVCFFVALGVCSFGNYPHHLGLEAFIIALMYGFASNTISEGVK